MITLEALAWIAPVLMVLVVVGGGFLAAWLDERAERRSVRQ
jgi:hypothetical protein